MDCGLAGCSGLLFVVFCFVLCCVLCCVCVCVCLCCCCFVCVFVVVFVFVCLLLLLCLGVLFFMCLGLVCVLWVDGMRCVVLYGGLGDVYMSQFMSDAVVV